MKVRDESPARVDVAVAHGEGQQLRQTLTNPPAVVGVERLRAAERKDGDRVGGNLVEPLGQPCGNLFAQIVLDARPVSAGEFRVVRIHGGSDMFPHLSGRKQAAAGSGKSVRRADPIESASTGRLVRCSRAQRRAPPPEVSLTEPRPRSETRGGTSGERCPPDEVECPTV